VEEPTVFLDAVNASYEGERIATLHDISLRVRTAERVAIIGPNGAGKTTLLEVINGLLPITAGCVHVFGQSISRKGNWLRAHIAYMAQELFFDPSTPFLVGDVVTAALYGQIGLLRWPSRVDRIRVDHALRAVGISDLRRRPIGRLSGGQQRKVLLARALTQRARLLLLDEPTANLDPEAKVDVARIVRDVEQELTATALVVSHEGGPLLDDAERLVRIEAGCITHDGPMAELRPRLIAQGV